MKPTGQLLLCTTILCGVAVDSIADTQPAPTPVIASEAPPLLMRDHPYAPHVTMRLGRFMPVAGSVANGSTTDYANDPTVFFLGGGARVHDVAVSLFFGIGGSGTKDSADTVMRAAGATPSGAAITAMLGVEAEYRLRNYSRRFVPFVGGAIGWNAMGTNGDFDDRHSASTSYSGLHLRAMAGVDLATSSWLGLGLVAEVALTRFGAGSISLSEDDDPITFENESDTEAMDLPGEGGTSVWAGISLRAVLFP